MVLKLGKNLFGSELLIYVPLTVLNWAQTLLSGFSIGGVDSTPPPWEPQKKYAVGNRVKCTPLLVIAYLVIFKVLLNFQICIANIVHFALFVYFFLKASLCILLGLSFTKNVEYFC